MMTSCVMHVIVSHLKRNNKLWFLSPSLFCIPLLQVPVFNKKEEIFDNLCEKDVPISRAAWYIKVRLTSAVTLYQVEEMHLGAGLMTQLVRTCGPSVVRMWSYTTSTHFNLMSVCSPYILE